MACNLRHENGLNEVQEELIGLLQEEAAEVIQELSKVRRTGLDFCRKGGDVPTRHFLQKELCDFLMLWHMAGVAGVYGDDDFDSEDYIAEKKGRLKKWTNLPHELIESI